MSIAVSTARAIIKQATADEIFDGAMPEDDATAISKAEELVEMAEQAWASNVRGPEVEKILKLAAADENGDTPEAEPESDAEPEPEAEAPEAEASSGDEDEEPEIHAPGFFSNIDSKLEKIEPYEAYGEDRVKDVTDALNWYLTDPAAEQTEAQQLELLQNTWAFETTHKNRTRILNFLIEAAKQKGFISEEEEASSSDEPESDGPQDSEPEDEASESGEEQDGSEFSEDEDADDGNGGDEPGEASSSEAPSESADADDDSSGKAGASSSEGGSGKAKPTQEDGGIREEYKKLIAGVDFELSRERIDIPKPPKDEAPELPWRWAEISDQDLQDFHMQYASMAYYKGYQRSREDRISFHCKEAADQIARAMMIQMPKDKDFKVTVAEAIIESDARVKRWRKLQKRHEAVAHQARQEMDSYYKLVEALSRLESMRMNSYTRSAA